MSTSKTIESYTLIIFNAVQKHIAEQVVPNIVRDLNKLNTDVDFKEENMLKYFTEIADYNNITRLLKDTAPKVNHSGSKQDTCDYIRTRAPNKGKKCPNIADYNIEGHSRCKEHKSRIIQKKNKVSSKEKKEKQINDVQSLVNKVKKNKQDQEPEQDYIHPKKSIHNTPLINHFITTSQNKKDDHKDKKDDHKDKKDAHNDKTDEHNDITDNLANLIAQVKNNNTNKTDTHHIFEQILKNRELLEKKNRVKSATDDDDKDI